MLVRSCERGPAGLRRAKRMRIRAGGGKVWHPPCPSSGRGEERRGRSCCLRWRHESTILRARILVILGYHSLALHRSIPRLQTLAPSQPRLPFHRSTHSLTLPNQSPCRRHGRRHHGCVLCGRVCCCARGGRRVVHLLLQVRQRQDGAREAQQASLRRRHGAAKRYQEGLAAGGLWFIAL